MKFTQPCLIMSVENKNIDWALFVSPDEEYTKEDVAAQCDKEVDTFYVYPVRAQKSVINIAEQLDDIGNTLKQHKPLDIPGMFTL